MLKINGKAGELTGPASLEPAVVLADTSCYYVRAFVEELDAPRVNVGMTAKVVIDGLRAASCEDGLLASALAWMQEPMERPADRAI